MTSSYNSGVSRYDSGDQQPDIFEGNLTPDNDLIMEQILDNMNNTPIGQVLKKIATLPEVRRKKILGIRRQLTEGRYDINDRLSVIVDKVLEDLTNP